MSIYNIAWLWKDWLKICKKNSQHLNGDSLQCCGSASLWCGSGCGSGFLFDADPDQTFYPDADPNPDPSFQKKAQTLEKERLVFHTFWLVICILTRIRIQLHFDADPVPDFYLMWIQILIFISCGCGSRLPKWCGSGSTTQTPWKIPSGIGRIACTRHNGVKEIILCKWNKCSHLASPL